MDGSSAAAIRPTWPDTGTISLAGGIPRLGPQAERSSAWVNRDGEVQPPTEREVRAYACVCLCVCVSARVARMMVRKLLVLGSPSEDTRGMGLLLF